MGRKEHIDTSSKATWPSKTHMSFSSNWTLSSAAVKGGFSLSLLLSLCSDLDQFILLSRKLDLRSFASFNGFFATSNLPFSFPPEKIEGAACGCWWATVDEEAEVEVDVRETVSIARSTA